MRANFWRYQLILVLLYIVWGGVFTTGTLVNQVAFNYAVFYPVGFLGGFRKENKLEILGVAFLFNLFSYIIVLLSGINIVDWLIVPIDFISMLLIVGLGFYMGLRMHKK